MYNLSNEGPCIPSKAKTKVNFGNNCAICAVWKFVLFLWTNVCTMESTKSTSALRLDREINNLVRESPAIKYRAASTRPVSYEEFLSNKMLIIGAIRDGISNKLFTLIMDTAPFTERDWAEFLSISTKSMQRYRSEPSHRFKSLHSEKIIEIAEVTQAGHEVFGDMEKFSLWLKTPNYALSRFTPMELLKDSYGKELVLRELIHISHGILA